MWAVVQRVASMGARIARGNDQRQLLFLIGLGVEGGQQGIAVSAGVPGGSILTVARCDRASGMGGGVYLLEHPDGDLGVDLGGGEVGMAKHGLDEPDVGPAFEHQRRHGVPEQMAGTALAEIGGGDVIAHKLGYLGTGISGDSRDIWGQYTYLRDIWGQYTYLRKPSATGARYYKIGILSPDISNVPRYPCPPISVIRNS